jgi:4-diphosphocytidyl-2C-methyl-D-erythritol kinase
LVLPPFGCATPTVFRSYARRSRNKSHNRSPAALDPSSISVPVNDLSQAAAEAYPDLIAYVNLVGAANGAMTGSGSTCVVPGHDFELPADLPGTVVRCWTKNALKPDDR